MLSRNLFSTTAQRFSPLSLGLLSNNSSTTMMMYSTLNEAAKIRKKDELAKQRAATVAERQKKLKEKVEAKEKRMTEKRTEAIEKKQQEVKKWLLNQKVKQMQEKLEAKQVAQRQKKKAAEQNKREKQILKQKLKKIESNDKPAKKKKDPNAPVRAMSTMFWYVKQNFAALKKELDTPEKGASAVQVVKLAKERMQTLPAAELSKYEQLAKQDKERYQSEMDSYKRRKQNDKKPLTTYFLFVAEKRSEEVERLSNIKDDKGNAMYAGKTLQTEIAKALGQRWKSLSQEQKDTYKQRYTQVMNEYNAKQEAKN